MKQCLSLVLENCPGGLREMGMEQVLQVVHVSIGKDL